MIEKLTPKDTVHNFCHTCVCSRADSEVDNCQGDKAFVAPCAFYPYRNGDKRISVKVFRAFCMDCQGDRYQGIENCNVEQCLVYPYRFGKNPAMIGRMDTRSRGLGGRLIKKEALL